MDTIGQVVRAVWLGAFLSDVTAAQDVAEELWRNAKEYPALDAETINDLQLAYAKLFAARVRIEQQIEGLAGVS